MSIKTIEKSVLIWYSAQQMFDLVSDVSQYPDFLPWCSKSSIVQQHEDGISARVEMKLAGLHQSFTTRNTHDAPHALVMKLVDGPFSHLDGTWRFDSLTENQAACRITFDLHYAFNSNTLAMLVGPMFDKIAGGMVDAFIARAEKIYG